MRGRRPGPGKKMLPEGRCAFRYCDSLARLNGAADGHGFTRICTLVHWTSGPFFMPKILGVHGIANTFLTAPQLTSSWFDALQGGIEEAGYPAIAPGDLTV